MNVWRVKRSVELGRILTCAAIVAATGCGGSPVEPEESPLGDLVGEWTATEFTVPVNGTEMELIGVGGRLTLRISSDGVIRMTTQPPGGTEAVQTGTIERLSDFQVNLAFGGSPSAVDYSVSSTRLTLAGSAELDLTGGGAGSLVSFSAVLSRQPA